jgi:hypothetical protein
MSRACQSPLTLWTARPIVPEDRDHLLFNTVRLRDSDFLLPQPLHLPLLLPKVLQCRHLELVDGFIPPFFLLPFRQPIPLESLSVCVGLSTNLTFRVLQLAALAPCLTKV